VYSVNCAYSGLDYKANIRIVIWFIKVHFIINRDVCTSVYIVCI